jgi:2',3'-cyclic-nucleotide 2'-phosphodiesterase (5'-nucleotidase family)
MKRFLFATLLLLACLVSIQSAPVIAAPVGKATTAFDNARPDKTETAWGRLATDALQAATGANLALIHAGVLNSGSLKAGAIEAGDITALLAFPEDEVVTITITGAQLRAGLERAVQAYPTGSRAFLHGAGFRAAFNTQAPTNRRITMVRVNGQEVKDSDSFTVAMPVSLAEGGAGYYTIWNAQGARHSRTTLGAAIVNFVRGRGEITPDNAPRIAPQ